MSNSPQSPFVVENLTPKSSTGAPQGTYELTRASVSPMRVVGRGPLGPIEETEPTVHWANFLMLDGGINKVPLRTGSVYSLQAEAKAYEDETISELVNAGCIPAHVCPYSGSVFLSGHPYITPPPGEAACDGAGSSRAAPDRDGLYGCSHLKAITVARRTEVLRKYNEEADRMSKMDDEKIARLHTTLMASFGEALAKNQPTAADRKQAAKTGGKGDTE